MNISFAGKVALVTGAASGLGLAPAKKTARAASDELTGQRHRAVAIRCDVAEDAQVEAMVKQTVAAFSRLDTAYDNAAIQNVLAETANATREDYDREMENQSPRRMELHEVRTAADAQTRKWRKPAMLRAPQPGKESDFARAYE